VKRRPDLVVAAAVLAVVAGCGGPDPSPSVDGGATASADAIELTATDTPLEPGRYTRSAFAPPITIELGEGWRAVQLLDGFFDVQQDVGSPDVIAVQFANVRGVHGAAGVTTTTDPDEAAAILQAHPGLEVVESSESRIDGLTGLQVTVENVGTAHAEVFQVPAGALGIDPGRRLWIAFFETDDGLLAIMVGGSVARWDEALLIAEPVLESVQIGPN
jgi:hypothetical protein